MALPLLAVIPCRPPHPVAVGRVLCSSAVIAQTLETSPNLAALSFDEAFGGAIREESAQHGAAGNASPRLQIAGANSGRSLIYPLDLSGPIVINIGLRAALAC